LPNIIPTNDITLTPFKTSNSEFSSVVLLLHSYLVLRDIEKHCMNLYEHFFLLFTFLPLFDELLVGDESLELLSSSDKPEFTAGSPLILIPSSLLLLFAEPFLTSVSTPF
jgi:hypothetical protein